MKKPYCPRQEPHTIVVPSEFSRDEAMFALEIEVARNVMRERAARRQALDQHQEILALSQGRDAEDARTTTARMVLIGIIAALTAVGIASCAMGF
jgi:DNA-binding GntR family transcriptional regulator